MLVLDLRHVLKNSLELLDGYWSQYCRRSRYFFYSLCERYAITPYFHAPRSQAATSEFLPFKGKYARVGSNSWNIFRRSHKKKWPMKEKMYFNDLNLSCFRYFLSTWPPQSHIPPVQNSKLSLWTHGDSRRGGGNSATCYTLPSRWPRKRFCRLSIYCVPITTS